MPDLEEQVAHDAGQTGGEESSAAPERMDFNDFVNKIEESYETPSEDEGQGVPGGEADESDALPSNPANGQPDEDVGSPGSDSKVWHPAWGREVEVTPENMQRLIEDNQNWQSRHDTKVAELEGRLNEISSRPQEKVETSSEGPSSKELRERGITQAVETLRAANMKEEHIRKFLGGIMATVQATERDIDERVGARTKELEEKYGKFGEFVETREAERQEVVQMADFLESWSVPETIVTPHEAASDRRQLDNEARKLGHDPMDPVVRRKIDRYQIMKYAEWYEGQQKNGTGNGSGRKPAATAAPRRPATNGSKPKTKEETIRNVSNSDLVGQIISRGGY